MTGIKYRYIVLTPDLEYAVVGKSVYRNMIPRRSLNTGAILVIPRNIFVLVAEATMPTHDYPVKIKRVFEGDDMIRMVTPQEFVKTVAPEDGYIIRYLTTALYIRDSDLRDAEFAGDEIIAKSWIK